MKCFGNSKVIKITRIQVHTITKVICKKLRKIQNFTRDQFNFVSYHDCFWRHNSKKQFQIVTPLHSCGIVKWMKKLDVHKIDFFLSSTNRSGLSGPVLTRMLFGPKAWGWRISANGNQFAPGKQVDFKTQ